MAGLKWYCAVSTIVSAVVRPSAVWMSHSARDQIWPSWWIAPVLVVHREVRVDAAQAVRPSAVYEIESQSAMHASAVAVRSTGWLMVAAQ